MGRFLEFAEVLEDKIRREIRLEESHFPSEKRQESSLDSLFFPREKEIGNFDSSPAGLAWLLGELDRQAPAHEPQNQRAKTAYGVRIRPPRPRKAHILSAEQAKAFGIFLEEHPEMSPGFTLRELKSAFRSSALRHHPDQGGVAARFREVHAAYRCLQKIFTE